MKMPKMSRSAELCLLSALSLPTLEALPLSGEIERRIHALVHASHYEAPSLATTLSPISASGSGAPALPPIAEFETNWTPRLFPSTYRAYPTEMLGWLPDEIVAQQSAT